MRPVRVLRWIAWNLLLPLTIVAVVPRQLVGRDGPALFNGSRKLLIARANRVADDIRSGVTTKQFSTGSELFDGEWAFGTNQMATLGLAQVSARFPADAPRWRDAMRMSSGALLAPRTRAFASKSWGSDAIDSLDDPSPRDAWLGYVALALAVHRRVDPNVSWAPTHDRIIASLRTRIEGSSTGLIETYPGETYPVDVSAAVAAIDVHAQLDGSDVSGFVDAWVAKIRAELIGPKSGYLSQTGPSRGLYRGSGTSLAAYFLGFAKSKSAQQLSRDLYKALRKKGFVCPGGFGLVREYVDGTLVGGDIDSGPVIGGFGVSVTGFAMASALRYRDREAFECLHRTASLAGIPYQRNGRKGFAAGGPLGNAILLAMQTASLPKVES